MTDTPTPPRRLLCDHAGMRLRSARHSLWLEGSQILHVRTESYSESSKRFALNDVQAIVITQTHWRAVGNALIATSALLINPAILALATDWFFASIPLALLNTMLALLLFINHFNGPTCITQLYTAVQVEDLRGCRRVPAARKMLAKLTPEITRVQGALGEM